MFAIIQYLIILRLCPPAEKDRGQQKEVASCLFQLRAQSQTRTFLDSLNSLIIFYIILLRLAG